MRRQIIIFVLACACVTGLPRTNADETGGIHATWDLTLHTEQGPRPSWVKFHEEDGMLVADFVGITGGKIRAREMKHEGETIQWTFGTNTYTATLDNGQLTGELLRGDERIPFTGEPIVRKIDVTGIWDVEIELGDRSMQRELKLEQNGDQVTGRYSGGSFSARDLEDVRLEADRLNFSFEIDFDRGPFTVHYDIQVQGDRLNGTVRIGDSDRVARVTGTRRRQWDQPIELFNGEDLSNWEFQQVGDKNQWSVVDGVMVNESAGWNIYSQQKFQDYKLHIDVKVPPGGNSGIYLNGRYEVQVADSHGRDANKSGMGAIYTRAVPTENPSKPAGEWQTFEIRFVDNWVTVTLNDTTIIDNVFIEGITGGALDSHESQPGPLMLQGDHGHIEYRNIVLTPLKR